MPEVKTLKYKTELDKIENCPNIDCIEREIQSYRFVRDEEINNEINWTTPADIQKQNNFRRGFKGDVVPCNYFALSFFDSIENATKKLNSFNKNFRRKFVGIAEGMIEKKDGVCSSVNDEGHFDLYEYADTSFENRFQSIQKIA